MRTITPTELKIKIDIDQEVHVLDIREPEKFEAGHIPGSINIFQKDVPQHLEKIPRSGMLVIVCTYGMKSDQVYIYLREKHKYKNLWILEGGLYDWSKDVDAGMVAL
jgi:rhodanese-related sulfurtransferase